MRFAVSSLFVALSAMAQGTDTLAGGRCQDDSKPGESEKAEASLVLRQQQIEAEPDNARLRFCFAAGMDYWTLDPKRRARWRVIRVQHVLWLLDRYPSSPSLAVGMARMFPTGSGETTADEYAAAKGIMAAKAAKNPADAELLSNIALFFRAHELFLAERYWLRALQAAPRAFVPSYQLGEIYGDTLVMARATAAERSKRDPLPTDFERFLRHTKRELDRTKDASLLHNTGHHLHHQGGAVWRSQAETMRLRAAKLDPSNPVYRTYDHPFPTRFDSLLPNP